jgi:hypothetical protein
MAEWTIELQIGPVTEADLLYVHDQIAACPLALGAATSFNTGTGVLSALFQVEAAVVSEALVLASLVAGRAGPALFSEPNVGLTATAA